MTSVGGWEDVLSSAVRTNLYLLTGEIKYFDVERLTVRTTDQRHHVLEVVQEILHALPVGHVHLPIPNNVAIW